MYTFLETHLHILRAMAQKTEFHARMCLLVVKKIKLTGILTPFIPERSFLPKSGLKIFLVEQRFTIGMLTYKRPLSLVSTIRVDRGPS